jgi:hypothetical protein
MSWRKMWESTIYHIDDLDFNPVEWVPKNKAYFMDKTQQTRVRKLLPKPTKEQLPYLSEF